MTGKALDPTRSFIVEAPAGSGKTELLIQRYLNLLGRVDRPEQIVAITFTRKAAAEMRQRLIETLKAAEEGSTVQPHRQTSLDFAREALGKSQLHGWNLVEQPRRLRVMTIDALNAGLAQQMPLLAGGIGGLGVDDDASPAYLRAARRTTENLAARTSLGHALRTLLATTDNSLEQLESWLASMLPQRDRWLRELRAGPGGGLAEGMADNLRRLTEDRLNDIRQRIDAAHQAELFAVVTESNRAATDDASAIDQWRRAAALLLTKSGSWRKRFTRNEGIPPGKNSLRVRLETLLLKLKSSAGLRQALESFAMLPERAPQAEQGSLLDAIGIVLPHLLAELRVLFEQSRRVDHTELALAAEQALGQADAPSELLLALDRRIEHILVDEFQDTSHLQWRLLELLTAGWEEGDGRTLFLVGDPMQSIYRFRDADLSLFVRAAQHGIGDVWLETVRLEENYRSSREIVDWVNRTFARIFPATEAADERMPAYRKASSSRKPEKQAGVVMHLLEGRGYASEIARVVSIVQEESVADEIASIGILVRSRSHVAGLRSALEAVGLQAHAIEIDSQSDTQIGQDLIGLTAALAHPADRLSWLGVLRSPWCGLEWRDLLAFDAGVSNRTVREMLADEAVLERLSPDSRVRVSWLAERLRRAFACRYRRPFATWVRDTWLSLDGPATLRQVSDIDRAEAYFAALDTLAQRGDIDDPAELRAWFGNSATASQIPTESGIEIMTMHRAKGLEFDTVILPGISRPVRGKDSSLLYLQEFNLSDGQRIGLLAGGMDRSDPMANYLQGIEQAHEAAEGGRLLYVAATRARRRLHLVASIETGAEKPRGGSLLATLWPALESVPERESASPSAHDDSLQPEPFVQRPLRRLRFDASVPIPLGLAGDSEPAVSDRPDFEWVSPAAVQVGTVIHRELERLAKRAVEAGAEVPPVIDLAAFRNALALLGVEREDLPAAAERVAEALDKVWSDPTGRWILKPRAGAWSEQRLTLREDDRLEHIQIDRSFIDEGYRWIIDYKTGRHLGSDVDGFLSSEIERYREQLMRYARSVAAIDPRPIRVALYFPLMQAFRECEPGPDIG